MKSVSARVQTRIRIRVEKREKRFVTMKTSIVTTCLILASRVFAGPGPMPSDHILYGAENHQSDAVEKRATSTLASVSQCTNAPYTRSCWSNGYSVADDFDAKWPTTGATRSYTLTVTNTTCNPDGHGARICMLYNNQYPGPTITAGIYLMTP